MKKRILSMLLTLCMILSLLPTAVFAADTAVSTQQELLDAIANASDGDTITLTGDIDIDMSATAANSGAIIVDKSITIDGAGKTLSASSGSGNATLLLITGGSPTITNLTVDGTGGAKHGIQVYGASAALRNVTAQKNTGYGVLVNHSAVTAAELITSDNGWGGVNVDARGAGSASFTMESGYLHEDASVVIEGQAGDQTATTINGGTMQNVVKHPDAASSAGEDTITIDGAATITGDVLGDIVTVNGGDIGGSVTGNQSLLVNGGDIGGSVSPAYQVTYTKGADVEVAGLGGSYAQGQRVTFTATANTGFELVGGSVQVVTASGKPLPVTRYNSGECMFTMPAEDVTVTVTAKALPGSKTVTFMNGNNVAGTKTVTEGATIDVADAPVLTPDAGYDFVEWNTKADGTGDALADGTVIDQDTTFYAIFSAVDYNVADASGLASGFAATAKAGEKVSFTLTPNEGSSISGCYVEATGDDTVAAIAPTVTGFDANTGAVSYEFTMPAYDVTIQAETGKNSYVVIFEADNAIVAYKTVEHGGTVTAPDYAEDGYTYQWVNLADANETVAPGEDIANITENKTYQLTQEAQEYAITKEVLVDDEPQAVTPDLIVTTPAAVVKAATGQRVTFQVTSKAQYNLLSVAVAAVNDAGEVTGAVTTDLQSVEYDAAKGVYTYTYQFTMPASDVKITGQFVSELRNFALVKFTDEATGILYDVQLIQKGDKAAKPAEPSKDGYTFDGWTDENGDAFDFDAEITQDVTVYAAFVPQQFEVKFSLNQGEGMDDTMTASYGDTVTLYDAPTRTGYVFKGWKNAATTLVYDAGAKVLVTGDMKFTAQWEEIVPETYTVKLVDPADGRMIDVLQVAEGTAPVLEKPTKAGYDFDGWYVDVDLQKAYDGAAIQADTVLYAGFTAKAATLVFNVDGGTHVDPIDTAYGEIVTLPDAPEKAGYDFAGWKHNTAKTIYAAGESYKVGGSATFTAQWTPKTYTVSFEADGKVIEQRQVANNTSTIAPAAPAKEGYAFIGWKNGNETVGAYEATGAVNGDTTYTAEYEKQTYTITYNLSGGTSAATPTASAQYGDRITLAAAPSRAGYVFVGWQNQHGALYDAEAENYEVTENTTFTALWQTAEKTLVKFKDGDGRLCNVFYVNAGDTITVPEAPAKTGYTFQGWYRGNESLSAGTTYVVPEDDNHVIVFNAKWIGDTFKLHVDGQNCESIKLTYKGTVNEAIDNNNLPSLEAGSPVSVAVEPKSGFAVSEVYYTTNEEIDGSVVTVKTPVAADQNGRYSFKMPAAETTLHVICVKNVYSVTAVPGANTELTILDADGNAAASPAEAEVGTSVQVAVKTEKGYGLETVTVKAGANYLPISLVRTEADGTMIYTFVMPASDVTVAAAAQKDVYTVQFVDYDNALLKTTAVQNGETVDEAEIPTPAARAGYTFSGWEVFDNATGTWSKVNDVKTMVIRDNTVLRACYEAEDYTITRAADYAAELDELTVMAPGNVNVNFAAGNGGSASAAVQTGETVTLTAVPSPKYNVTGVTVTTKAGGAVYLKLVSYDAATGAYTYQFEMPADDVSINAYTEAKTYAVSVNEIPAEGGDYTINGYQTANLPVKQGEQAEIQITAAPGYTIASVKATYTMDGGNQGVAFDQTYTDTTETTASFKMVGYDVNVEITYQKESYTVTAWAAANGEITVSKDGGTTFAQTLDDANVGDKIMVKLHADEGYTPVTSRLAITAGNDLITANFFQVDAAGDYYYEFTMPASDVDVFCEFSADAHNVIAERTIDGGQVWVGETKANIAPFLTGEEAVVRVIPDKGYRIADLTYEDGSNTATAPYFKLYKLDELGNKEYIYDSGKTAYNEKYANPVQGYSPVGVTVQDNGDGSYTYTIDSMPGYDVYVETEFVKVDFTVDITTKAGANGTTTVGFGGDDGDYAEDKLQAGDLTEVHVGDSVYVKMSPADGYGLKKLNVTYKDAGGKIKYINPTVVQSGMNKNQEVWSEYVVVFEMPAADVTVTTEYTKEHYFVVFKDWDGTELKTQSGVDYMDHPTAPAKAPTRDGYTFAGWTSTYTTPNVTDATEDMSQFNITQDTEIVAVYTINSYDILYTPADLNEGKHGAVAGTDNAKYQELVTFTATPETGYMVDQVKATYTAADGTVKDIDLKSSSETVIDSVDTKAVTYTFDMPACKNGTTVNVSVTFKPKTYEVTADYDAAKASIELTGNGTTAAAVSADTASQVKVKITPAVGYELDTLTYTYKAADGTEKEDTLSRIYAGGVYTADFTMPASDVTVKATFKAIRYKVIAAPVAKGGAILVDTPEVDYNAEASFTVTPEEGYMIESVTATYTDAAGEKQTITFTETPADLVAGGTYKFVMPENDVTVTAVFAERNYLVTVDLQGSGEIRLDDKDTLSYGYDYKDEVTLTVTPAEGWEIKSVDSAEATVTDNQDGTYTFTMPAKDVTIHVVLEKIGYTVSTKVIGEANGGTVTASKDTANVGDNISAEVTANYGYDLVGVVVTGESGQVYNVDKSEDGKYYFTMPAENVTITAEFAKHQYTVVFKDWDGKVLSSQQVPYQAAAVAPETPAREGYTFVRWDTEYNSVTKDLIITAVYTINSHTADTHAISFTGAEHGTIQLLAGNEANYGERVVFTADPDDGWRVENVAVTTKSGKAVTVARTALDANYRATYTFTMPDEDVDITVRFVLHGSSYFTDVRTDMWCYDAVTFVADRGYFKGMTETLFAPNMNMNRGMFVTVLGRIANVDVTQYTQDSKFSDVNNNAYYAPYVQWGVENGIVKGFADGTFRPTELITREQMAALMHRFCVVQGYDLSVDNANFMDRYTDLDKIGAWAYDDVEWVVSVGLMRGKTNNTIDPKSYATRAQVAQVIKNMADKVLFQ